MPCVCGGVPRGCPGISVRAGLEGGKGIDEAIAEIPPSSSPLPPRVSAPSTLSERATSATMAIHGPAVPTGARCRVDTATGEVTKRSEVLSASNATTT